MICCRFKGIVAVFAIIRLFPWMREHVLLHICCCFEEIVALFAIIRLFPWMPEHVRLQICCRFEGITALFAIIKSWSRCLVWKVKVFQETEEFVPMLPSLLTTRMEMVRLWSLSLSWKNWWNPCRLDTFRYWT